MNALSRFPAASLAVCLAIYPAAAQDYDKEMERPRAAIEAQDKAERASAEARESEVSAGSEGVTYEDVLADPDNIDLNYKYAKAMIAVNNLRQAAATLERILMVNPALPRVRLTYAVVLYRLDNLPEAQRELEALQGLPMPASLKAEIEEYIERIRSSRRLTNIKGRLGIGWQYDNNRNAAPESGTRLFFGTPLRLVTGTKENDTSLIFNASVGLTRDLQMQGGHDLFANIGYYRAEQTHTNNLDLQAYTWDFGGNIKSGRYGTFTPRVKFGYISIEENTYLRTRGVDFGWARPVNSRLSLFGGFGTEFHEFINNPTVTVADERTGQQTNVRLGLHYLITPRQRLTLQFKHTDKDARQRFNAYRREGFSGSHALVLPKGMFWLSSLSFDRDKYIEAETAVDATLERRDIGSRIGFTLGVPLDIIATPLKDLLWTANWNYFHSTSNIVNYEYDNHTFNTTITYKFNY